MLTPKFDLSQNEEFLFISIHVPYAKISEVDIHHEDTDFMFFSKPYYLRLNLPGKVQYSANPSFDYDVDKKMFTIRAPKVEKGQMFEGLDLITKLKKENKTVGCPMIEVIDGLDTSQDDDEEFDWNIEQKPSEELDAISIQGDQCGFAKIYSYSIFGLKEETREIFDVKEPQYKSLSLRREERLKTEFEHFDEDHYIADLYHDEEIQHLLKYRPEWEDIYDKMQSDSVTSPDDIIHFTAEEKDRLLKLPNKEYILDKSQVKTSLLGLVDIIFAYAYNKRTTEGENTVESGWTVNKLSTTLSWLETFSSLHEVALACIRRSLCYPLYRHFELSVTVLDDVRKIFLLGRKYVIKCLLEIHEMFCLSDPRYLLNDLFITDYCVWMQTKRCSSKKLVPLANALEKVLLTKGDIGFNLVDVESFAAIAWMAHNPSAKEFPTPIIRDKYAVATEKAEKSHPATDDTEDICMGMDKLSFQKKQPNDTENYSNAAANWTLDEIFDEYAGSCSSCSSGSSCSSSYTFESDSDDSYSDCDSSSSSDSEDSDSSDSDDGAHQHLLKKESGEKNR